MSVDLSVADVRAALLRDHPEPSDRGDSTRLLARLFHEIHADLFAAESARNGPRFLLGLERDRKAWSERLIDQCYRTSVGPRLARHKAYLHGATPAVLAFWEAVRALVELAAEIAWTATEANPTSTWEQLAPSIHAAAPLACEIEQPGWSDSVRLTGVADCMLWLPARQAWSAVELRLGPANPSVELGCAALYRLIAGRLEANGAPKQTPPALVRFSPRREDLALQGTSSTTAQSRLLASIGTLAGVAREARSAPSVSSRHARLGDRVVKAYREFGKAVEIVGDPILGARFLRFEARLGKGVRFEQIKNLAPEVALRLNLAHDPILSRAGGRLTIDLARPDPETVAFDGVADEFRGGDPLHGSSRFLVGVGIDGRARAADLAESISAHVLVAGMSESGKTEWLRSAIASLLLGNTPSTLRLVLLDPKQTAFGDLKASPFLLDSRAFWAPDGETSAGDLFARLVAEVDRRHALFKDACVDDLRRYVEATGIPLPRVVVVCDEYTAVLSAAAKQEKKQIETAVGALGAKARAAGVHLVLATQQASRKVLQGSIDTNIPSRVALTTFTVNESRMVLQADGANQLTGNGDLLYKDIGEPVRLQAAYLEPKARARVFGGGV